MLFDIMYDDQKISIVLSKIIGIAESESGKTKCHLFIEGDQDGINSTEDFNVTKNSLMAALEQVEERRTS
jgi:hypothetical protein